MVGHVCSAAMPTKLVDLEIEENSGVDHPAHLVEGWLVMKNLEAVLEAADSDEHTTEPLGGNVPEDTNTAANDMDDTTVTEEAAVEETVVAEEPTPEPETVIVEDVEKSEVDPEAFAKELADLRKEATEAKSLAKALMDERDTNAAIAKAEEWNYIPAVKPDEFGPTLKTLRSVAPEATAIIEKILDSTNAALSESEFFVEIGSQGRGHTDATSTLDMEAKALVDAGNARDYGDAIAKATAANPSLANTYRNGIRGR